jgi:hypothetical protein
MSSPRIDARRDPDGRRIEIIPAADAVFRPES